MGASSSLLRLSSKTSSTFCPLLATRQSFCNGVSPGVTLHYVCGAATRRRVVCRRRIGSARSPDSRICSRYQTWSRLLLLLAEQCHRPSSRDSRQGMTWSGARNVEFSSSRLVEAAGGTGRVLGRAQGGTSAIVRFVKECEGIDALRGWHRVV